MLGDTRNPFDLLALPPTATPEEITLALRERIEDAAPEERPALRALWERLVAHPRERVLLALGAHPRDGSADPVAQPYAPDLAAVAAIVATVTPADELLVLPLASTAVAPPPAGDPLAVLAAELGEER